MRAVIIAAGLGPRNRGVGQYEQGVIPHLVAELAARDCDSCIVMCKDGDLRGHLAGARIARMPVTRDRSLLRFAAEQMYIPLIGWRADFLLSLGSVLPLSPLWAHRKSVVMHDIHVLRHTADPDKYPEDYSVQFRIYANVMYRRAVRAADRIIAVSEFTSRELRSVMRVPSHRVSVVPCGVDHARFRPPGDPAAVEDLRKRYSLPDQFYLFVGPYSRKKNLRVVVQAYRSAELTRDIRCPVVVVGDTRRSELYGQTLSLIDQSGLSGSFRFLGSVPDLDMPLLYSAAKALLYPSLYEGFGLPPLEAMACGTPVVASNRTSIPEVVGNAALLIDPEDPASLAAALQKLAEEPLRKELIRKGLERAQLFSWQRTARLIAEQLLS